MELGDLKDSLLNLGNEKGKELADNLLGEREQEGGVTGAAAGYGKEMLDNALSENKQDDSGVGGSPSSENTANTSEDGDEDNNSGDNSKDDNSDDDNDDDNNNQK